MISSSLEDEIQNLLLIALETGTDVSELHLIVDHAKGFYEQAKREAGT